MVSLKDKLKEFIKPLKEANIEISLFVDPVEDQIRASAEVGADAVEIHTGTYANLWNEHRFKEAEEELRNIERAGKLARDLGLRVYAGHGLTYHNVKGILKLSHIIEELNIGHSIVANAVIFGFERAVREMLSIIKGGRT